MENNKIFDPAGVVDLSELDALASNDAAGLTPVIVSASAAVSVTAFVSGYVSGYVSATNI